MSDCYLRGALIHIRQVGETGIGAIDLSNIRCQCGVCHQALARDYNAK